MDFDNIFNIEELSSLSAEEINRQYEEKTAELEKAEEKKRLEKIEEHYLKESGVKDRYKTVSLDNYVAVSGPQIKALDTCRQFADGKTERKMIYLFGSYGTGKTHLACGMIRKMGGDYLTSFELCIGYESMQDFKAEKTRMQYLSDICNKPVLVIDEIGRGKQDTERLLLPYIINERYNNMKPLIMVSNLDVNGLKNIIGQAGADRLAECCIAVELNGESYRRK